MEILGSASSLSSSSSPRSSTRWNLKESIVSLDNGNIKRRSSRGDKVRTLASGKMRSAGRFSGDMVGSSKVLLDSTLALVSSSNKSRSSSFSLGSAASSAGSYAMALESLSLHEEGTHRVRDDMPGRRRRNRSIKQRHMVSESQERWNINMNESLEDYMTTKDNTSITSTSPETDPPSTPEIDPRCTWSLALPKNADMAELMIPRVRVSVSCAVEDDRPRCVSPPTEHIEYNVQEEISYWSTIVTTRIMSHGTMHTMTAEAFMEKGHACMRGKQYVEAVDSFKSARRVWKSIYGDVHLSVAKASDGIGMAYLRSPKTKENLLNARKNLDFAFTIRYHELGPWHVDTVDSFNKIASVHLHLCQYNAALKAYEQVYLVRKAIFGEFHPSVAVSAHALANVHFHLSDVKESLHYYNLALEIYTRMDLDVNHPTVGRLLHDRKRLDRILMAESCVRLEAKDQEDADYF